MASLPKFTDSNGKSYIRIGPGEARRNALPFDVTGYSELRLLVGVSLETLTGAFPTIPSSSSSSNTAMLETLTPGNATAAALYGVSRGVPFAVGSDTISMGGEPGVPFGAGRVVYNYTTGGNNLYVGIPTYRITGGLVQGAGGSLAVHRNGSLLTTNWQYNTNGYDSRGLPMPIAENKMAIWGLSARLDQIAVTPDEQHPDGINHVLVLRNLYSSRRLQAAGFIDIDQALLNAAVASESLPSSDLIILDWGAGQPLPNYIFVRNLFVGLRLRIYLLAFVGIV